MRIEKFYFMGFKDSRRRKVKEVTDGDTFVLHQELEGSKVVRIANLNAAELNARGGNVAKNRLKRLIENEEVTIKPVGKSYGRIVAKVFINRRLVKDQV